MPVKTLFIEVNTRGNGDVLDITDAVQKKVNSISYNDGIVTVFVPGSTASVTTIEYETGVVNDVNDALERAVPEHLEYQHHLRWHDGNGHSHVKAAWLGPSLTIPFCDKTLMLGTWQQIVLMDFDNTARHRKVVLQIIGE